MISFESDYNNGCHPAVMQRLVETNDERSTGYGLDPHCAAAATQIREACNLPATTPVYFLTGGTQTNATVIDALLRQYQGVLSVDSGHVAVHEAGAIEASGHKVLALPAHDGKMHPDDLTQWLEAFYADPTAPHMVQPGMVYLTFPTELGTIYTYKELQEIRDICHQYHLPLYIDGARLPYGLAAPSCDLTLPQLAALCDVFYLGGTKCGALLGEAVVFSGMPAPQCFFTTVKQHGALLAKGRLLGVQFDALMTGGLYFDIARQAVKLAMRLRDAFVKHGYRLWADSPTNQQFIILPHAVIERLSTSFVFEQWSPVGDDAMNCRFVTSWATTEADVAALEQELDKIATK